MGYFAVFMGAFGYGLLVGLIVFSIYFYVRNIIKLVNSLRNGEINFIVAARFIGVFFFVLGVIMGLV